MYSKFFKRLFDFLISLTAILVLSPVFLILIIAGTVAMRGNPFFTQLRPGKISKRTGEERIFKLIKFRTMSNARDKDGKLLPDDKRLNKYGRFLRSTSLDELPELWNILIGDMSLVGPRPLLVHDLLFMNDEQRKRHTVTQGLTGLAQINGRNNITWERKFEYDLEYINNGITFLSDLKIILRTFGAVFSRKDTVREGTESDIDFGDWLLERGTIDKETYDEKMNKAKEMLRV